MTTVYWTACAVIGYLAGTPERLWWAIRAIVGYGLVTAAFLYASGCGASAIRTHAIAAHELHGALEVAGDAIEHGTDAAIAACPHDDTRQACLDRVEHEVVAAAALRDAMIAPADAYRAAVLAQCPDQDTCAEPSDDILAQLAAAALAAFHDAPALIAALRALGLPIPGGLGGQ